MNRTILSILNEIANESSTNKKMEILSRHASNELLKRVIYLAMSKRIKFHIKQLPEYHSNEKHINLESALVSLEKLYTRNVTGNEAIEFVKSLLSSLSGDDSVVLQRIIQKDLKIGMGSTNVNKVIPDLIEKTPYMGAISYSKKALVKLLKNDRCVSQEKMDGLYCNAIINGNTVDFVSRQGNTLYLSDTCFAKELETINDCVLCGELTINGIHRYTANGMVNSIVNIEGKIGEGLDVVKDIQKFEKEHGNYKEAKNKIRYTVWDTITIDEYFSFKSDIPYSERLYNLENMMNTYQLNTVSLVDTRTVNDFSEVMKHYTELVNNDLEGTVVKSLNGTWKNGKPNWQIKVKKEEYFDLVITDFKNGTIGSKNENRVASVEVKTKDGKIIAWPCGMSDELMDDITVNKESYLGKVVIVKCNDISHDKDGNYSLLHPVFKGLHPDKTEANSFDECMAIHEANEESK